MKNMVPPPRSTPEERERRKKAEEMQKKMREAEQSSMLKFKGRITNRIMDLLHDEVQTRLTFEPMSRQQRGMVHEIAEQYELVVHSFGDEEIDRHVVIFKAEHAPGEAELNCLKKGEVYVPKSDSDLNEVSAEVEELTKPDKKKRQAQPEYLQKYEKHFRGLDVAKAGAKKTETSRSYGCVSSEQKKDKRTIEETLADIKSRKKGKPNPEVEVVQTTADSETLE